MEINSFLKKSILVTLEFYLIIVIIMILLGVPGLAVVLLSSFSFLTSLPILLFIGNTMKTVQKVGTELRSIKDERKLNIYMFTLGIILGIFGNLVVSAFFEVLHQIELTIGYRMGLQEWLMIFILPLFVLIIFSIEFDRFLKEK